TLYRAATGTLPFTGDDWYDIARQQIEDAPRKPRELNSSLSPAFEHIILRCLEKQAAQRYDSADALRLDLMSLSIGPDYSETSTAPYQPAIAVTRSPMQRTLARRRVLLGATTTVVVLVLANAARSRGTATPGTLGMLQARPLNPSTVPVQSPLPPASVNGAPGGPALAIRTDSAAAPLPLTPRLRILAPADAQISLDGRELGRGDWRSDSAPAGTHWIVASFPTLPGCPTARDSQRVTLVRGTVSSVHLSPQPCAMLAFKADSAAGARFTLSASGRPTVSGVIPSTALLLPVGNYQLHVSKPLCAEYNAELVLRPDSTVTHRFAMIC
ncbi:MAG: hypothetical protein M3081_03240, partial [Gemmatimonadota bacterium]|nr:hypothetical protein [Gemmatimonadota bacterium]